MSEPYVKARHIVRWERRNAVIFFGVMALTLLTPLFSFLARAEPLKPTLFEREQDGYRDYLADGFDGYEEHSEYLDAKEEDLSRWQKSGAVSAWLDLPEGGWRDVNRVDLELTDASGKSFRLRGVENAKLDREDNVIKSDDRFADHSFRCDQTQLKWEDYMLVDGENFLFWEIYGELPLDMGRIVQWQAMDGDKALAVRDVVVADGLCRDVNAAGGAWSTPNGLPQYGVWWTDGGQMTMRHVQAAQYPSNGDHVRILSRQKTPKNFLLKTTFTVKSVAASTDNTYVRIAWDFDDVFDPGHDETIVFASFDYDYVGLQRVFPVARFAHQGQEPETTVQTAKERLRLKAGVPYELNVQAEGQTARAEIYEIVRGYHLKVAEMSYTFNTPRPDIRYPFAVEATGNVEISLDDFVVKERPDAIKP